MAKPQGLCKLHKPGSKCVWDALSLYNTVSWKYSMEFRKGHRSFVTNFQIFLTLNAFTCTERESSTDYNLVTTTYQSFSSNKFCLCRFWQSEISKMKPWNLVLLSCLKYLTHQKLFHTNFEEIYNLWWKTFHMLIYNGLSATDMKWNEMYKYRFWILFS
jgi:hypothetical protein